VCSASAKGKGVVVVVFEAVAGEYAGRAGRTTLTSFFSRSISLSGMRGMASSLKIFVITLARRTVPMRAIVVETKRY
jgi:hypothetical protein